MKVELTHCLVEYREAKVLVEPRIRLICLEDQAEAVARRHDRLVARVISISRVGLTTELPQHFLIMDDLKRETQH